MTISITVPGVTFTKFVSKVLMPFADEASAFNLYGTDAASSLKNQALGASINSTAIASPTYGAGFATCSNVNGFNTGFLMDAPYTQIIVSQWVSGGFALLGRGAGNADNFVDMLTSEGTEGNTVYEWADGSKASGVVGVPSGIFSMQGARWGGTGTKSGVFVHGGAALLSANGSSNRTKTVTPTNTLKVGAGYGVGTFKVAATMFIPRVLSDAELGQVRDYLKPLLASRGVTMA